MTRTSFRAGRWGLMLGLLVLLAAPATADDTTPTRVPLTDPQDFELLPLSNVERMAFAAKHPQIAQRGQVLARRAKRLREQLAKRKNKDDAGSKKIRQQLAKLKEQTAAVSVKLYDLLADEGFDASLVRAMNACPPGDDRIGRYARGLVLHVPQLENDQRALFEVIIQRMHGARQALLAQKARLSLAAKQSELARDVRNPLVATFDRHWRETERRFWMLVDYVLDEDQRAALGRALPSRYQEKANPVEHLFALPELRPEQFARVQAILTETEAEASADKAAQLRVRQALKEKGLSKEDRKALQQELAAAGKRLGELHLDTAKQTKAVLTDAQIRSWEAIPPRVSANDRRERPERVLQGMPLDAEQRADMQRRRKQVAQTVRQVQAKRRDIARMGADYGPDSPQQMMMQTMMAGVQAEGARLSRAFLGDLFLDVLRPDQVSAWVLGHYGRKR